MDKFYGLHRYLKYNKEQEMTLTFAKIEELIGQRLCASAYKYQAYWSPSKTHILPNTIEECGYRIVRLDLKQKTIVIRRFNLENN